MSLLCSGLIKDLLPNYVFRNKKVKNKGPILRFKTTQLR